MDAAKLKEAIELLRGSADQIDAGHEGEHLWRVSPMATARLRLVADAAEAHLATLPQTKEVAVFRVEFACPAPACRTYRTFEAANFDAATLRSRGGVSCVKVTGPHMQTVPA